MAANLGYEIPAHLYSLLKSTRTLIAKAIVGKNSSRNIHLNKFTLHVLNMPWIWAPELSFGDSESQRRARSNGGNESFQVVLRNNANFNPNASKPEPKSLKIFRKQGGGCAAPPTKNNKGPGA